MSILPIDSFVSRELNGFIGKNIDLVGNQIEDLIDASSYIQWRWLEPDTSIYPEHIPWRVNVHVTRRHKIVKITVG